MHLPKSINAIFLASITRAIAQTPPLQDILSAPKAPGTFSNGKPGLYGEPPQVSADGQPEIYGVRDIDLPFYRLYNGTLKFFSHTNDPAKDNTTFGSKYDAANQSACGIPYNAWFISTVAIHPYFLKYAGLDRYCMQDVCISFWQKNGKSDMMLKVTDICSTDPKDPTYCAAPADIKIDRTKAKILYGLDDVPQGNEYPEPIWWFFMKCWDDGTAQPAYQNNNNWFTEPPLLNNLTWAQSTAFQQYKNNQKAYPAKGWPTYPNGGYNTKRNSTTSPPITDWAPGQEPKWSPLAGGAQGTG